MTENKYSWLERELITYGQILQRTSPENTQKVKDTFKYTTQAIIAKIEAEKAEAVIKELEKLPKPDGTLSTTAYGLKVDYVIQDRIKELKEEA